MSKPVRNMFNLVQNCKATPQPPFFFYGELGKIPYFCESRYLVVFCTVIIYV